jgi:hypothetical protein
LTNASFSGSTIFSLLIDSHPDIVALGDGLNPQILRMRHEEFVCACGDKVGDCGFWSSVMIEVRKSGVPFSLTDCNMRYSFLMPNIDRLVGRYNTDPARSGLRWILENVIPAYKRHVRLHDKRNRAFIQAVRKVSSKKVFIHNTKPLLMLHYLSREDPDQIYVIDMVRDPRGFVYSATKRGMTVSAAAARWCKYHRMVRSLLTRIPSSNVLKIRYEDVCEDARSAIAPVCRFLGVEEHPISQVVIPREHHVLGNDLRLKDKLVVRLDQSWKDHLSAADIRQIGRKCGAMAEKLGYAL